MPQFAEPVLELEPVDADGWRAANSALLDLLDDALDDGASLGFRLPLDRGRARTDWLEPVAASLAAGRNLGWLARDRIDRVVLLGPSGKQNAPHRAEVQKLIVHRRTRRRGLGAKLMARLEEEALARGLWLLELDTDAGSVAFYRRLGWREVGVAPDYSLRPNGVLKGTRILYKDLREPSV